LQWYILGDAGEATFGDWFMGPSDFFEAVSGLHMAVSLAERLAFFLLLWLAPVGSLG
jgi:hypothetical protein